MSGTLRQNAQRCFEIARAAVSADARAGWLEMAQFWLQKAESRERPKSMPQQQQQSQPDEKKN